MVGRRNIAIILFVSRILVILLERIPWFRCSLNLEPNVSYNLRSSLDITNRSGACAGACTGSYTWFCTGACTVSKYETRLVNEGWGLSLSLCVLSLSCACTGSCAESRLVTELRVVLSIPFLWLPNKKFDKDDDNDDSVPPFCFIIL